MLVVRLFQWFFVCGKIVSKKYQCFRRAIGVLCSSAVIGWVRMCTKRRKTHFPLTRGLATCVFPTFCIEVGAARCGAALLSTRFSKKQTENRQLMRHVQAHPPPGDTSQPAIAQWLVHPLAESKNRQARGVPEVARCCKSRTNQQKLPKIKKVAKAGSESIFSI